MGLSCRRLLLSFLYFCTHSSILLMLFSLKTSSAISGNETDRLALLEFKAKTTIDPFGAMTSWNSSKHFCNWYGVTCSAKHQRVTVLNLASLRLSGSISPHIGNLSFLRELYLQNNSFSHEIPRQIDRLRRLQILYLQNNSLTGEIPSNISSCSNLVLIRIQGNKLMGQIPMQLGSLSKLKILSLGKNNLTGMIPASLGNLSSLIRLYAYYNNLFGALPHSLGQLMNILYLSVFDNSLSGTVPPSIFNLSSLTVLDVGVNQLQGYLPSNIFINLPKINVFSVGTNRFAGSIPTSLPNATNLEQLQLNTNSFTGSVPPLEKLNRLWWFTIAQNNLGNGMPNDLSFLHSLTNVTSLEYLGIHLNSFGGNLPEQICNFSEKLEAMVVYSNKISGSIPVCLQNLVRLTDFEVQNNKLSGTIPFNIGMLQNLTFLNLGQNNLSGTIPSSLGNLTSLIKLQLGRNKLQGEIPLSLGNCQNLIELDLSSNDLRGVIPPQLTMLSSLSIFLDLSRNHFSGSLPVHIGNLNNLGILDVSENMLSGDIPTSLGSCVMLEFLSMEFNFFRGPIPASLSSLRAIQLLNLSHNNLSGKIPEFLQGFNTLETLDLSYNNFAGVVPVGGVFKNASNASVAGNSNLCGGIPDFRLPSCKSAKPKRNLSMKLKIIISAVPVSIAATLVLACLFLYRLRKSKGESTSSSYEHGILQMSYQSLLIATNGFSSERLLGIGSFGSVYKGILDQESMVVAVKVINHERPGASKSFIAECEVMRNVRHRNLIKILTACSGVDYQGNDFKALVYEFMQNGNLDDWLHPTLIADEVPRSLSLLQRLSIAIDVACAIEYLHHHCETPIVHGDLKPRNVLLDDKMIGHVSDFGSSKFLSERSSNYSNNQSSLAGIRGTIGYAPPEYGVGGEVSTEADVYSYGILLLEMFTGKRPTDGMFTEGLNLHNFVKMSLQEDVSKFADPVVVQVNFKADSTTNHSTIKGFNNNGNSTVLRCLRSIFEIAVSCSAESPRDRMNITNVLAQLSDIRNKLVRT